MSFKYLTRAFSATGYLFNWFTQASADGKVTVSEMTELITGLASIFDWTLEFDVPQDISGRHCNVIDEVRVK